MKSWRQFQNLFRRRKLDAEMASEMQHHLDLQTERHRAAGMNAEEAGYAAQRTFGNVAGVQQRVREQRGWWWAEQWLRDLRFAGRSLARAKGFSLAVLATLALCLGPNTAILSALYGLVYKPLPFPEPQRLVSIAYVADKEGGAKHYASVAQYLDFKAHADAFAGFGYFVSTNATIGAEDAPIRGSGLRVSSDFFSMLEVQPHLGRAFLPEEQRAGQNRVVMLSYQAWAKRYRADPNVIGREILLDGESCTVVGVAPACFEELFTDVEFFQPFVAGMNVTGAQARYAGNAQLIGRLKAGVTIDAARAQLLGLEKHFSDEEATPQQLQFLRTGGYRLSVEDAHHALSEPLRAPLLLLQGCAVLVLLIGCINVASLLQARMSARRPELAIRQALGAGSTALLRQMLAESFMLVGGAGVVGAALAWGMLRFLNRYQAEFVRHVPPFVLDGAVLTMVFTAVVGLVLAMAVIPFVLFRRAELKIGETPRASVGRRGRDTLNALVVGQVALAVVLLTGAGLLMRSFARVIAVDPGFDATRIVQGRVHVPYLKYQDPQDNIALQQRLLTALKEIPGAEKVSSTTGMGVDERYQAISFLVRDRTAGAAQARVYLTGVSPDYFPTMGIRLLDGRYFQESDEFKKTPVAVVDQTFAARYFPGEDIIGRELALGDNPPPAGKPWIRIVGVVARANLAGLEARDGWPFLYLPSNQQANLGITFLVRSPRPEADIVSEMRSRLRAIDPTLPLSGTGTLASGLDMILGRRRALLVLLGLFAGLALLLASVGLYGVLNYDVLQRTREIGIRGAIGATRGQIVQMILRQGLTKAALGVVVGLMGAAFFSRLLTKMLFDVTAADPMAYGAVIALLIVVAVLASWLPARRAAKVDPVVALRAE